MGNKGVLTPVMSPKQGEGGPKDPVPRYTFKGKYPAKKQKVHRGEREGASTGWFTIGRREPGNGPYRKSGKAKLGEEKPDKGKKGETASISKYAREIWLEREKKQIREGTTWGIGPGYKVKP